MTIRAETEADHDLLRELWEEFEAELDGEPYLRETWDEAWEDLSVTVRDGVAPVDVFMVAPLGPFADRIAVEERPASYGSLHVQTDDDAGVERAVTQFMPRVGHTEWTEVAATRNGWVAVTDELCDHDRNAQRR